MLLRPVRGCSATRKQPRVPLRSTLGYIPAAASRLKRFVILPVVNGMHDRFVRLLSENDYSIGGISSIATMLTAKQATAIRLV